MKTTKEHKTSISHRKQSQAARTNHSQEEPLRPIRLALLRSTMKHDLLPIIIDGYKTRYIFL